MSKKHKEWESPLRIEITEVETGRKIVYETPIRGKVQSDFLVEKIKELIEKHGFKLKEGKK